MKAEFPQPKYDGPRRRWALSELRAYDAQVAGDPAPPPLPPAEERFLTAAQVRERYGNVSDMWLWRRINRRDAAASESEVA